MLFVIAKVFFTDAKLVELLYTLNIHTFRTLF